MKATYVGLALDGGTEKTLQIARTPGGLRIVLCDRPESLLIETSHYCPSAMVEFARQLAVLFAEESYDQDKGA